MSALPVTGQFEPPPPKKLRRRHAGYLTVIGALFLCLAHVPSVRADAASCIAKVSSYVIELDELLSRERNWITPYHDLNKRHFPFRDCETDAFLEAVRQSNFTRRIRHNSRPEFYVIEFANDKALVDFAYFVSEKKSSPGFDTVGWINK